MKIFQKNKEEPKLKAGPLTSDGLPTYYAAGPFIATLVKGATPRELAKALRNIEKQEGTYKEVFLDIRMM